MPVFRNIHRSYFFIYFSVLGLYLFSLQNNFSASHDAITYLNHISAGKHLFHPHHLLYNAVLNVWLNTWHFILPFVSVHFIIESFSAVCGSGIVLVSYIFFTRRFFLDYNSSAVCSVIIAFSYGVWCYSTNIEVYAPSILFSLLVLLRLSRKELTRPDLYVIAGLHILAILFHQVNVLLTPVIIVYVLRSFNASQSNGISGKKAVVLYLVPTTLIVLATYILTASFYADEKSLSGIIKWTLFYATELDYWHPFSYDTLPYVITGLAHAFIGAHFVFRIPFLSDKLTAGMSEHSLSDELYLSSSLGHEFSSALLFLSVFVAILMIYLVVLFIKNILKKFTVVQGILVFSLLIYSLFFIFWMPENLEFWIFQSVIIWMLILGNPSYFSRKYSLVVPSLLAASLFFINYFGSIVLLGNQERDLYYSRVHPVSKIIEPGDIIILEEPWILDGYIKYFTPGTDLKSGDPNVISLSNTALAGQHKVVIFESSGTRSKDVDSLYKLYNGRINTANDSVPYIRIIQ
ncbi:MAG: hypothetical protein ACXWV4_03340 [Flavitalea sp.]